MTLPSRDYVAVDGALRSLGVYRRQEVFFRRLILPAGAYL